MVRGTDAGRALVRWVSVHRLTLAAGLAAALPVIVSTVRAVHVGWFPVGDDAVIAVRSIDVLTLHPPLVGQFSVASGGGPTTHSLGPMLYWLLAIPARIGPAALVITVGLLNTACVVGMVGLARRRGGPALMFPAAAGIAVMCASLVPDTLHSVWNPSVGQLPLGLLMFVAWSVACGEHRLLPLGVLLSSFVVQSHLTYVLPVVVMAAVAVWGLRGWVRERPERRAVLRKSGVIAVAVGLVCWSAPLLEQLVNRPGNLAAVGKAATVSQPKLGASAGVHTVARSIGVPPWWLRSPQAPFTRLAEVVIAPGTATTLTAAALILGLLGAAAVARRRGRPDLLAAAAIALGLCLTLGLVAAATPKSGGLDATVSYTLRWSSPAGLFVWMAAAWAWAGLLGVNRVGSRQVPRRLLPALGLVAVFVAGLAVARGLGPDVIEQRYKPARQVTDRVEAALRPEAPVLVRGTLNNFDLKAALTYDLRRRRGSVLAPDLAAQLGERYDGLPAGRQVVTISSSPARGPGRVVARSRGALTGPRPSDRSRITVTLLPVR